MKFLQSFIFILFVFILHSISVQAATLQVCPQCNLTTLRQAIEHAAPHDLIKVKAGIYPEGSLVIDKPLHIQGESEAVVDGLYKGNVFLIKADEVTLENLIIKNSGQSYVEEYAGIRIIESHGCRIINNRLLNNVYSLYLAKVEDCNIENNLMIGNAQNEVASGNGVHFWYSKKISVKNNDISHHRDGLYLEFTPHCQIEKNISHDNIRYGLHFMYSSHNRYIKNRFIQNQSGVAVMYSNHIEMQGNDFERSWGPTSYGLLLKEIRESLISENYFSENTVGVFADGISHLDFVKNTFIHNGWALNILGNIENNVFKDNDFLNNYFNVATNSKNTDSLFTGNYWSDYKGYDLNRDGQGDIPFRPMKVFSLWVGHYPELVILLGSPVIEFLEIAERIFPVMTPENLEDIKPRMRPMVRVS